MQHSRDSKPPLVFAAIALGMLGAVAYLALRHRATPLSTAPAALSDAALPAARNPAECKRIALQYAQIVEARRACTVDSDCLVETRTNLFATLDGCYRISSRQASMEAADRLADAWLAGSCIDDLPACEPAPVATCRKGTCAERPPAGIPDDWRRERVPGALTMFLPPDLQRVPAQGEDSFVLQYQGNGRRLVLEIGEYAPDPSPTARTESAPWDALVSSEPVDVSGRTALLYRYRVGARVDQPRWAAEARVPGIASPWRLLGGAAGSKLYFGLDCDTSAACDAAPLILRTMTPLTETILH